MLIVGDDRDSDERDQLWDGHGDQRNMSPGRTYPI